MFVDELEERITEYSTFITNTLQPQLKQAVTAREETEEEICEYFKLGNSLQMIIDSNIDDAKPINTFVDISHQTLFCNATISNPLTVYVNIGFGFHVEFTINEAISFIDKRILYLKNDVLKHRSEVATTIAEDVEKALAVLEEFKAA